MMQARLFAVRVRLPDSDEARHAAAGLGERLPPWAMRLRVRDPALVPELLEFVRARWPPAAKGAPAFLSVFR